MTTCTHCRLRRNLLQQPNVRKRQDSCFGAAAVAAASGRIPCSSLCRTEASSEPLRCGTQSRFSASRPQRSRSRGIVACLAYTAKSSGNGPATSVSAGTNNIVPKQHQQQQQPLVASLDPQQQQQQLQIMHQLVQQQQSAISKLQSDVQQLRWAVETHPGTPLPNTYVGTYKGMGIEDFRSLPDKIIMMRHAESQGNVDAKTYCTTPDYEVWSVLMSCSMSPQHCQHSKVPVNGFIVPEQYACLPWSRNNLGPVLQLRKLHVQLWVMYRGSRGSSIPVTNCSILQDLHRPHSFPVQTSPACVAAGPTERTWLGASSCLWQCTANDARC